MARSYTPGFYKGILDEAWFAKHNTEDQVLGVKDALNVVLEPDGSLAKRPGSRDWQAAPAPSSGTIPGVLIPYQAGDDDYIIYFRVDLSVAANRTVHVWKRTGDTWNTTEIDWRSTDSSVGLSDFSPYIDNSHLADTDLESHWYDTSEAPEVRYTQYDDKLFIFHPNHPTVMIWKRPNNVWEYDPYALERHPPEIGGNRRGLTWTITPPASGVLYTVDTNQGIFEANQDGYSADATGGFGPGQVAFNGTNAIVPGSFYRFGDISMSLTANAAQRPSYGAFWTVFKTREKNRALISPVHHQTGAGAGLHTFSGIIDDSATTSWAGPWNRSTVTLAGFTLSAACHSQEAIAITGTGGQITESMLGTILLSPTLETIFMVLDANSGAGTATLVNLGKDVGAVATGTLYLYEPQDSVMVLQGEDDGHMIVRGKQQIPEGHETAFVDNAWLVEGPGFNTTATNPVGGSVFGGDQGIVRPVSVTDYDLRSYNRISRYVIEYQKRFKHIGAYSEYGWGPSTVSGFAAFGCTHQRRLFISGFKDNPSSVVGSEVNRPLRLNAIAQSGLADGALNLILGFEEGDPPQWLQSGDFLKIGCDRSEYILDGNPISTGSLGFEKVGSFGSDPVDPIQVGPSTVWVGKGGKQIWEGVFEDRHNSIVARSLMWQAQEALIDTDYSETITKLVTIQQEVPRVFALTSGGKIFVLTHAEETGTKGWTRWFPANTGEVNGEKIHNDRYRDLAVVATGSNLTEPRQLLTLVDRQYAGPSDLLHFEFIPRYNNLLNEITVGDHAGYATSLTATTCAVPISDREYYLIVDGVYGGKFTASGTTIDYTSLGLAGAPSEVVYCLPVEVDVTMFVPPMPSDAGIGSGFQSSVRGMSLFLDKGVGGTANSRAIGTPPVVGAAPDQSFVGWRFVPGSFSGRNARFPTVRIFHELPYFFRVGAAAFEGGTED